MKAVIAILKSILGLGSNDNFEARAVLDREFFIGHASHRSANRDQSLGFYKF